MCNGMAPDQFTTQWGNNLFLIYAYYYYINLWKQQYIGITYLNITLYSIFSLTNSLKFTKEKEISSSAKENRFNHAKEYS